MNCVVIFVDLKLKKNRFPRINFLFRMLRAHFRFEFHASRWLPCLCWNLLTHTVCVLAVPSRLGF